MAKTLELTLSSGYVRNWNVWEAIRELLQNGIDAHDKGHSLRVEFIPEKEGANGPIPSRLKIINEGVTIGRDALILGNSTKADDANARGQFGEGFKLAWMVLLRAGKGIWAKSGSERWTPSLGHSNDFNSEVVKVECAPVKHENIVRCDVRGLSKEDWENIRDRMIFLKKPRKTIEVGRDTIILSDKYRGRLYVKGIFVCDLPDEHAYGYDLYGVDLDRDRTLADPWSLRRAMRRVLTGAVERDLIPADEVYKILDNDRYAEARVFRDYYAYAGDFERAIAAKFEAQHGEDALPVSSIEESVQAQHLGIKGVVSSPSIKAIVEKVKGNFSDKKKSRKSDAKKTYSAQDLTPDEIEALMWALRTFRLSGETLDSGQVNVVDFYGDGICGTYRKSDDSVRLARRILSDRRELIATLVHEVAHRYGGDGTVDHRDAIDRIFGDIVVASTL